MRYVIDLSRKSNKESMINVIRMEIDYELVSLHDAIQEEDTVEIIKTKEKLINLVTRLKKLLDNDYHEPYINIK